MKTYRVFGKLVKTERLNNSVNGNPRWKFFLITSNDTVYEFKTQTDSFIGYIFNPHGAFNVAVDYHVTRSGNLICEAITYGVYKEV